MANSCESVKEDFGNERFRSRGVQDRSTGIALVFSGRGMPLCSVYEKKGLKGGNKGCILPEGGDPEVCPLNLFKEGRITPGQANKMLSLLDAPLVRR